MNELLKFSKYLITYIGVYALFYFSLFTIMHFGQELNLWAYKLPLAATSFSVLSSMIVTKYVEIKLEEGYMVKELSKTLDKEFTEIFTTNIHHELSTPVLVLENAFYNMSEYCSEESKLSKDCQKTFGTAFNQVITILEKSSSIKEGRLTPNTSIFGVLKTAFDNLSLAYTFDYFLDEDLKKISLKTHKNFNTSDFINTIFALAKNSLEAGADRFDVYITQGLNSKIILFMDNGTGIRNKMNKPIHEEDYPKIFELHYSTKDKQGNNKHLSYYKNITSFFKEHKSTRGVGLWLNKTLLKYGDINLELENTSKKGTSFKLILNKGAYNVI